MDSLSELMQLVCTSRLDVGYDGRVTITHLNDPDNFYIRPVSYNNYMKTVEAKGKLLKVDEIGPGKIVIYKSEKNDSYIRGNIISIQTTNEIKITILAVDYGFMELINSFENIYAPLESLCIPPLASLCKLAYCKPKKGVWKTEATNAMKYFISNETCRMFVVQTYNEQLIVQLYNSCPDDISTMLAYAGHSVIGLTCF